VALGDGGACCCGYHYDVRARPGFDKIVAGLQSRPALNGTAVEIRQLDETSGRHVVSTADGEMIKLKAQNLVAFADAGVSDMRERGNAAFTAKRFYEAIEWYTAAISPGDSRPKANRAAAFLEVGDYGACEKDVADALLLVEPDAAAKLYCRLAKAQAYAGKYDEALESFRKVSGEVDTTSAQLQAACTGFETRRPIAARIRRPSCRPVVPGPWRLVNSIRFPTKTQSQLLVGALCNT
jgi:tetratricopeptide (TPR) repeat protein